MTWLVAAIVLALVLTVVREVRLARKAKRAALLLPNRLGSHVTRPPASDSHWQDSER